MVNIEARNRRPHRTPALAMPRFFNFKPSSIRLFSPATSLFVGFSVASFALGAGKNARADEFSVLPPGDPIAVQLAVITPTQAAGSAPKTAPVSLTRYEAALQTARVILDVQNRETGSVSRAQWRAIAALCGSLQDELRQLGVDVEAARALAAKNLRKTNASVAAPKDLAPRVRDSSDSPAFVRLSNGAPHATAPHDATPRATSILTPELVANASAGTLARVPSIQSGAAAGTLEMQLLPGLRVATGLQAARTSAGSLQNEARFAPNLAARGATQSSEAELAASQTALSYDLGRYLTLRAANSRLNWNGATDGTAENPWLGAPLFAGARGASGTGGGVELNLGAGLKFSTEVERLRADTGALASRIGGGASLSAFRDRLLLNMSLSRLLPGDKSALTTTAAEVGASLDVSSRLSLNLRYQGLFAPTPNTSAARVAGGVSLSF